MASKLIITGTAALLGFALRHTPGPGFRSPEPHRHSSGTPVKPYRLTGNVPHQGAKERARRLRQAERARAKAGSR